MATDDREQKLCRKCSRYKPLREFTRDETHRDGLTSQCNCCRSQARKSVNYRNQRHSRQRWADGVFGSLHLTGRDY